MKPLKHVKIKNTAIIFEVLSQKLISEVMSNTSNIAFGIVKKYFHSNTLLHKELRLYKSLLSSKIFESELHASKLIDDVLTSRKQLESIGLKKEKYSLIKTIKETYGVEFLNDNFNISIPLYKELASVYKLFEYDTIDNPSELMSCRITISELLTLPKAEAANNGWSELSRGVRVEAFKNLLHKFNEKYKDFDPKQKDLLRVYINTPEKIKEYILKEITYIESSLKRYERIDDEVLAIKLHELRKFISEIRTKRKIEDSHVSAILKSYELINELKK